MNPSQTWTQIGVDARKSSLDLEFLKITTTYAIRVLAYMSTGSGLPSDYIDVKTLEGGESCFSNQLKSAVPKLIYPFFSCPV